MQQTDKLCVQYNLSWHILHTGWQTNMTHICSCVCNVDLVSFKFLSVFYLYKLMTLYSTL